MTSLDKLSIDTPEQLALDFPLAGIGSRFLALLIDTLLQVVAGFLVAIALMFVFFAVGTSGGMWVVAIWIIVYFLIQFGYFAIFESIWNGQTPGKRQMQLRVIKDDGRPITVYDAVARNLLRLVDAQPGIIHGIGVVSMMFSKQNKRLGDYVAGTVVVHEKKLEGGQPTWQAAAGSAGSSAAGAHAVARLSAGEVQLIEAFLDRRSELDVHLRSRTAEQIAERIGTTMGVPREERKSAEAFLEEVLAQRRNLPSFGS